MVTAIGKASKFDAVSHSCWEYFLELEGEVASTKRFVAFERDNINAHSSEFLRVCQATCSEHHRVNVPWATVSLITRRQISAM